jgi:hypothetical protein
MARTGGEASEGDDEEVLIPSSAWLSDDGVYRYRLNRRWDRHGPQDVWIMLNPSTADASLDDPTIRRCKGFSARWGAAGITVVNLFAYRATDPAELVTAPDPIGPSCDFAITEAALGAWETGGRVIAAWGSNPMAPERARMVCRRLDVAVTSVDRPLLCVGTTSKGAPRHPLYVRGDKVPTPWRP